MLELTLTIEKCNLLHNILNTTNEKLDFAFMCIEISFIVMKYWGIKLEEASDSLFDISKVFIEDESDRLDTGMGFLKRKVLESYYGEDYDDIVDEGNINFISISRYDIWNIILLGYYYLLCE